MPREFTVTVTNKQAGELRELAAYWHETVEETLRRVTADGLDVALQIKDRDEREAAGLPFDDDISF